MKNTLVELSNYVAGIITASVVAFVSFIGAYFFDLTLNNYEQYIAVISVVFLDGIFGIIKAHKRKEFETKKALKVLRTAFIWIVILSVLLAVEKGFNGTGWLSETIMIPFILIQIISTLKNASMAGYIKSEVLNNILDKIDKHKGERKI